MSEQFRVGVPYAKRVAGWLYDVDSGECIGIASDEMKEKRAAGVQFTHFICGCPHKATIHPWKVVNPGIDVPCGTYHQGKCP